MEMTTPEELSATKTDSLKILDSRINWYTGYANHPKLELTITKDEYSKSKSGLKYTKKGSRYWAENRGLVSFLHYSAPGRGFGGASFTLDMDDNTQETLIGPWSSRSSVMNLLFPHSIECTLRIVKDLDDEFPSRVGSAVLVDFARPIVENLGAYLIERQNDELDFIISTHTDQIRKPGVTTR